MSPLHSVCVAVSHYNEDLRWADQFTDCPIYIISKTDPTRFIFQPENLGFEASSYLEFICHFYHQLPEWVIFVHGHEFSWHHTGGMQDLLRSTISNLNQDHIKYKNINAYPPGYYITNSEDAGFYNDHPERKKDYVYGLKTVRDCIELGMFRPIGIDACDPPNFISRPAAQFVVHRDLIQQYSHNTYKELAKLLHDTPYDDKMKACVYEAMWTRIFTLHWNELEWDSS